MIQLSYSDPNVIAQCAHKLLYSLKKKASSSFSLQCILSFSGSNLMFSLSFQFGHAHMSGRVCAIIKIFCKDNDSTLFFIFTCQNLLQNTPQPHVIHPNLPHELSKKSLHNLYLLSRANLEKDSERMEAAS